ncbi:Protein mesh [Trichostrongylus colubriformis]|uniref:Protein mesh n=1 Tax=Trichostrongylus colubriformis TaxID=6319 RepID=A0AAN8G1G4_TRICO
MYSAYMQGDVARFECVQSHWIKGVHEYKCGIVVDYNRPNEYRFEWNKGEQPWCRSREKENFFIWLSAILGTVAIIMAMIFIFLCCWCVKQQKREEKRGTAYGNGNSRSTSFTRKKFGTPSFESEPLQEKPRYTDMMGRESASLRVSPSPGRTGYRIEEHMTMPSHISTPESAAARPGSNLQGFRTSV